jgi:hypothetical protein
MTVKIPTAKHTSAFHRTHRRAYRVLSPSGMGGIALGTVAGAALGGPVGALVGAALGVAAGEALEYQFPSPSNGKTQPD